MNSSFLLVSVAAIGGCAMAAQAQSWMAKECDLAPLDLWTYKYEACGDTTGYASLNRALALKVGASPQFARYRTYRTWENGAQAAFIGGAVILAVDMLTTKAVGGICSPSFNPACDDLGWTMVSPWYYLGFFSVTVPLNVFASHKRIGFMEGLVSEYNRVP